MAPVSATPEPRVWTVLEAIDKTAFAPPPVPFWDDDPRVYAGAVKEHRDDLQQTVNTFSQERLLAANAKKQTPGPDATVDTDSVNRAIRKSIQGATIAIDVSTVEVHEVLHQQIPPRVRSTAPRMVNRGYETLYSDEWADLEAIEQQLVGDVPPPEEEFQPLLQKFAHNLVTHVNSLPTHRAIEADKFRTTERLIIEDLEYDDPIPDLELAKSQVRESILKVRQAMDVAAVEVLELLQRFIEQHGGSTTPPAHPDATSKDVVELHEWRLRMDDILRRMDALEGVRKDYARRTDEVNELITKARQSGQVEERSAAKTAVWLHVIMTENLATRMCFYGNNDSPTGGLVYERRLLEHGPLDETYAGILEDKTTEHLVELLKQG